MQPPLKPVYLNLFQLHLPVTGWVSILHRLSGALLFFALPLLVWMFSLTFVSEAEFTRFAAYFKTPFAKFSMLMLVAGMTQHFLAGLRHLAMDAHWGMGLNTARATSFVVLLVTGAVVLLTAWFLFR